MRVRKYTRSTILLFALISTPLMRAQAQSFDSAPHVLVLPGHTNSLSAGPGGEVLVTCDYKTLDGKVPRPGEPCTGEPTLAISVEDLRNLRYISEAKDNNELVSRVYEKYDDIVFIVSPDFEVEYGNPAYHLDVSPVSVMHSEFPEDLYIAYARRAQETLKAREAYSSSSDYTLGVTIGPYGYDPAFDGLGDIDPLANKWRPWPQYTLVFLPANPSKSTIIHELMHFLIQSSRDESIVSSERLQEFRKNHGFGVYLRERILNSSSSVRLEESRRAAYELANVITLLDNLDETTPEEIEVNYFISKYRDELGLIEAAEDHKGAYWHFADFYVKEAIIFSSITNDRYSLPQYAQTYVRENLPLRIGDQIRPNYFRNVWASIKTLANAYPQGLLGDENNPEPGTMMYQFLRDVGNRSETMR